MPNKKSKSKQKPPTMRDVAKLAGVSQPTVSRVLNHTETSIPVSEATRERVFAAVRKLGYRPNRTARSLRTQRTQMIALMIADISNGFYHPIARAVQDIARQHDYDVLIANSNHVYENERHFCEAVMRRPVDGVIMVPIRLTTEEIERFITFTSTPVAVLGEQIVHPQVDVVWVDDGQATYEAINWLIRVRGHRQIGFLGVPDVYPPGPRRWQGFRRALQEADLTIEPRWLVQGGFTLESGRKAAQQLIAGGDLPTALFVLNDLMAIGAILAFQDAGYSVPEDIAVVGVDDIPEATIIRPNLTTIAQTPYDIGNKLATALFERINGHVEETRRTFECQCRLIVRQSA
jgi:DNA-binding LacI/PurR family transcriptional regulator